MAIRAEHAGPIVVPSLEVGMSVSHHDDITVLALCKQPCTIGVDIEPADENDWEAAVEEVLTPHELTSLMALAPQCRPRAYFTCWTLKESVMKVMGEGLDKRSPGSIEVSLPPAPAELISIDGDPPSRPWALRSIHSPGHVCSLATASGSSIAYRCYSWPPLDTAEPIY